MALRNADRVKETSTTTGTGTYSLAGAVAGFQTFVAGVGTGNYCHYCAEDGTNWEVGIGLVTDAAPDTLARTVVLQSSNGDAAVSWAAGTRNLFCVAMAVGQASTSFRNIPIARALTADVTTTGTTGVEVTGLEIPDLQPGTYAFQYTLIAQTDVAATGIALGVNFTGTQTRFVAIEMYPDAGGSAATNGTIDDATTGFGAEQIVAHGVARTLSTTAPNLNVIAAFATATVDHVIFVKGVIVVSVAGNLELWWASESGTNLVRLKEGSSVVVQQTN